MYELMVTGHEGLTLEKIATIPLRETRQPLLQWLDRGARDPARLSMHTDPDVLRKMQQNLGSHGVRTEVRKARESPSGRFPVDERAVNPEPPPTADTLPPTPVGGSADSGLHQYRRMVAEMDQRRSSATHVISSSVGFRPMHVAIIVILAIIGVVLALAAGAGGG